MISARGAGSPISPALLRRAPLSGNLQLWRRTQPFERPDSAPPPPPEVLFPRLRDASSKLPPFFRDTDLNFRLRTFTSISRTTMARPKRRWPSADGCNTCPAGHSTPSPSARRITPPSRSTLPTPVPAPCCSRPGTLSGAINWGAVRRRVSHEHQASGLERLHLHVSAGWSVRRQRRTRSHDTDLDADQGPQDLHRQLLRRRRVQHRVRQRRIHRASARPSE